MTANTPVPLPDSSTGLIWRSITPEDVGPWLELIERMAEVDKPIWFERRQDLEEVFGSSKNDPALNSLFGLDEAGIPRAFGRVTSNAGSPKAYSWGGVDPQWRRKGIGTAVYRWQEARARQRFAEAGVPPGVLRTYAEENNQGHRALMESMGTRVVRYWTEMTKPLSEPIPGAELDSGLEFVTFNPEISDSIRQAHNEAFQDHWGSEPRDEESWRFTVSHPDFKPEWSMAVIDTATGEVAGYHIASMDPNSIKIHGYSEGYTELVGVRSGWRGRGIAPAILVEAMRRFKDSGVDNAGLQVDTENPSGALGLYERLGYTPTHRTLTYDHALE